MIKHDVMHVIVHTAIVNLNGVLTHVQYMYVCMSQLSKYNV